MSSSQRFAHAVNRMLHEDRRREERLALRCLLAAIGIVAAMLALGVVCHAEQPRIPRAYFFTASWCGHCKPALTQLRDHANGWQIGESVRDHVQIIDIDRRADLAELHGVTQIPCVMLVDGKDNKPVPYHGPWSVYGLFR